MNKPGSKEIRLEVLRWGIDTLGIREPHLTGSNDEGISTTDNRLIWFGQTSSRSGGAGLLLNKKVNKCFICHSPISDRLLTALFNHKQGKMTIVVSYAPTIVSPDDKKDRQTTDLSSTSSHDVPVLVSDINMAVADPYGNF